MHGSQRVEPSISPVYRDPWVTVLFRRVFVLPCCDLLLDEAQQLSGLGPASACCRPSGPFPVQISPGLAARIDEDPDERLKRHTRNLHGITGRRCPVILGPHSEYVHGCLATRREARRRVTSF